jgi:hypothetical protein
MMKLGRKSIRRNDDYSLPFRHGRALISYIALARAGQGRSAKFNQMPRLWWEALRNRLLLGRGWANLRQTSCFCFRRGGAILLDECTLNAKSIYLIQSGGAGDEDDRR